MFYVLEELQIFHLSTRTIHPSVAGLHEHAAGVAAGQRRAAEEPRGQRLQGAESSRKQLQNRKAN